MFLGFNSCLYEKRIGIVVVWVWFHYIFLGVLASSFVLSGFLLVLKSY